MGPLPVEAAVRAKHLGAEGLVAIKLAMDLGLPVKWVQTRSENMLHGLRLMGRLDNYARGSRHGRSKLTERDIPRILTRLARGERQRDIAEDYGVSKTAIYFIRKGANWRRQAGRLQ